MLKCREKKAGNELLKVDVCFVEVMWREQHYFGGVCHFGTIGLQKMYYFRVLLEYELYLFASLCVNICYSVKHGKYACLNFKFMFLCWVHVTLKFFIEVDN